MANYQEELAKALVLALLLVIAFLVSAGTGVRFHSSAAAGDSAAEPPVADPAAATVMVGNINPGAANANPNYGIENVSGLNKIDSDRKFKTTMAVIGSWAYFAADDGTGYALWRSNGTVLEKLGAVKPIRLTPVSWTDETSQQHDMLLFIAWSEAAGWELWRYDPALPPSPKRGG